MPILRGLEEEYKIQKPFAGTKVSSVHLEAKQLICAWCFAAGGADMSVTGNVLSNTG